MNRYINECGVVLINSRFDKVLIIFQNESLKWGLPKGHMDPHELNRKAYFECAKRELLEETGIMISTHKHKKIGTFVMKDKIFYIIQLMKDVKIRKPRDTQEIGDIRWLNINSIIEFMNNYRCNITLKEINRYISTIYESHHRIANV
jgi:8-oxo-dGTP pyrophosphatase MutT (NUDIX family)